MITNTCPQAYKFTGKERDPETNLDYFGARYYSSQYGRFASADLPFIDQHPANPQTWNLYFYARNNPLKFVDPTGNSVSTDAPMNHLGLLPGVHGSGPDPMTTPASDGTWGVHTIYDAETMEPISQARIALGPTAPMARHFAHVGVLPVSQTQARGPTAEQVANMLYNESAGLQPNDPGRPAWAQGTPVQTHGPFLNRSPGHLPAGIQVMVEIYP